MLAPRLPKAEPKHQEAAREMLRARISLLSNHPFYGCLALHLELIEWKSKRNSTMCTDGRAIYYNPDFVMAQGERELVGVVAHEVGHCSYKHFARRNGRDPKLWNKAGDYVINGDLLAAGFKLPECRLYDKRFDGMYTEQVYNLLKDEQQKQGGKGQKGQGGPGQPGEDEAGGGGEGDEQSDDPGGCGGVVDASPIEGDEDSPGQTVDDLSHEWDMIVRQGIAVARAQNAGKTPGYLERLVKLLNKPRITYEELLRNYLDHVMRHDTSWRRPNMRYATSGFIMPGRHGDAIRKLVLITDTSGSITPWMLNDMATKINAALEEGVVNELYVVHADAAVCHVDTYYPGDNIQLRLYGDGGTSFRPGFAWVKENAPDATAVLYLTDMFVYDFGDDPGIPVMWLVYGAAEQFSGLVAKAPFGHGIYMDVQQEAAG